MGAVKASHDSKELPCNRSRQLVSTSRSRCIVPAALIAARRRGPVVSTCGREHVSSHWPICSKCRYLGRQILGGLGDRAHQRFDWHFHRKLGPQRSKLHERQYYTNDNRQWQQWGDGIGSFSDEHGYYRPNSINFPTDQFIYSDQFTMVQGVDVCRGLVRRLGDHDFVGSTAYGNLQCNLAFCVFEQWT